MTDTDHDRADFTAVTELAEAFTALVHALGTGDGLPAMSPERIVAVAAACMPSSRDVALTVAEDDRARLLAATSDLVRQVDRIQAEVGHGPVLDIVDTNDLVISNDLAADLRWPVFGTRAVDQLGIRSVVGYRLYLAPGVRAALTFYSEWPHAFDDLAIATGSIFAAYCSLVVFTETVLGTQLTPRKAAEVHREIGVAIGILMSTEEIDTGTAFRSLHRVARQLHRDLPEVARHVVGHRRLPDEYCPRARLGPNHAPCCRRDGPLVSCGQDVGRRARHGRCLPRRSPIPSAATTTSMIVIPAGSAARAAAPDRGEADAEGDAVTAPGSCATFTATGHRGAYGAPPSRTRRCKPR